MPRLLRLQTFLKSLRILRIIIGKKDSNLKTLYTKTSIKQISLPWRMRDLDKQKWILTKKGSSWCIKSRFMMRRLNWSDLRIRSLGWRSQSWRRLCMAKSEWFRVWNKILILILNFINHGFRKIKIIQNIIEWF